ncbi:DUF6542 domain-containing protein [Actinomadura macrotermitis]|uniref:DUF6542 domain-containing protein n=1 Tax=Actinomadura macrotermitis TaxID=2585200 RepID=A0A7K0BT81_9ACTN|nr:DUF6542 domain-containing protein [Actinomadura macrotermitis]MQY03894.1 hypothetical protein [Actinomadura macrotermitis]
MSASVSEAPESPSPATGGRGRRGAAKGGRTAPGPAIALTGRGGIVVMFAVALLGALPSHWFTMPLLAGLGFLLGCAVAALLTRPSDLLTLVVSPPLVFLAATVVAVVLTGLGDGAAGIALGVVTALAATAPWLFAGTVLVVVITTPRGMLREARELRGRLAGLRLFAEEENQNPVRWDESAPRPNRRLPHGDVD